MQRFGPGFLVAAAFIGPGTITTATAAGGQFGFSLAWALLFSVFATMLFQTMAARLGLVSGAGLAEAMRQQTQRPVLRSLLMVLILAAIGIGNAAYQGGNITGAALAISQLWPGSSSLWALLVGASAALLLATGRYQVIQNVLLALVGLMSLTFLLCMFAAKPDWSALLSGLFVPRLPSGAEWVVIALIGTTVVPYNLFLHASLVNANRDASKPLPLLLKEARWDTGLSIGLGGLITLAVIATSATAFFAQGIAPEPSNMAAQLTPILGDWAATIFALGLFAAGLTSAITAPLATAYAVCGILGWRADINARHFKAVWLLIILIGSTFAALGAKPLPAILLAQGTNGLLLPVIAVFLLLMMNNKKLLGEHVNGPWANVFGALVVLVVSGLGVVKIVSLF